MDIETLKDRLILVVDKYSSAALEEKSLQSVSRCLRITEHALKILRSVEPRKLTPVELALDNFVLLIEEKKVTRHKMYQDFISFCQSEGIPAMIDREAFADEMIERGFLLCRNKSQAAFQSPSKPQNRHSSALSLP